MCRLAQAAVLGCCCYWSIVHINLTKRIYCRYTAHSDKLDENEGDNTVMCNQEINCQGYSCFQPVLLRGKISCAELKNHIIGLR